MAQGISVVHLYPSQLRNLQILIPTAEEQKKIVDFLSELELLLKSQSERIESLKFHKKGLLQQLFPQLD
jgi:type I restriction enzyme S subunit